jgi:protein-disulfide isomerase
MEGLTSFAEENTEGLDYDELQACIDNQNGSEAVSFDNEVGRTNGVSATPTVFVNEDRVSNWNNLASIIEDNYQ